MYLDMNRMLKLSKYFVKANICFSNILHTKHSTSALYVTGDMARETYSFLTPHLDFDDRFKYLNKLETNVKLRGINLNVKELKSLWDSLKVLESNKVQLEKRRVEIADKMKELRKLNTKEADLEMDKYRTQGKLARADLKVLVDQLWKLEKDTIIKALVMPNDLHPDTPIKDLKIVHEFGTKPKPGNADKNHLSIGRDLQLLNYYGPSCYYLKSDAALFELDALNYFAGELENLNFIEFSNPDFAWSLVVEGCGIKHKDPDAVFTLQNEDPQNNNPDHRLHLLGGGSLGSFCAFHAKQTLCSSSLPLKYFALGRKYQPNPCQADLEQSQSLFNVWQASAVEFFIATSNERMEAANEFDKVLGAMIRAYENIGNHFRLVYLPARCLNSWESLRASIQMYSCHLDSYIEVGSVCVIDDFISKRLLMCYEEEGSKEQRFTSIVSGTAVILPKLMACLLEYQSSLVFPQHLKQKIPI